MFIEVRTSARNKWETTSVNIYNINYIEPLNLNVFYEYKSKIVFNDGSELITVMEKYEIMDLLK